MNKSKSKHDVAMLIGAGYEDYTSDTEFNVRLGDLKKKYKNGDIETESNIIKLFQFLRQNPEVWDEAFKGMTDGEVTKRLFNYVEHAFEHGKTYEPCKASGVEVGLQNGMIVNIPFDKLRMYNIVASIAIFLFNNKKVEVTDEEHLKYKVKTYNLYILLIQKELSNVKKEEY